MGRVRATLIRGDREAGEGPEYRANLTGVKLWGLQAEAPREEVAGGGGGG